MSVQRSAYPSVRALHAVVDAEEGQRSRERVRQLRMTVRQLERALDEEGALPARARREVRSLLNARNVDTFLELAASGVLRGGPAPKPQPLAYASMRILRDCLAILGQGAGVEVVLPRMWQQPPKPTVPPAQQAVLYRRVADMAAADPVDLDAVGYWARVRAMDRCRLLAIVGVVLDTGARASELCGQRVDDLGAGVGSVRVVRRPQNGSAMPLEKIAARAGVSVSVVSRVLAEDARPSDAAYDAVLAAVEELGEGGPVVERYPLREGTRAALRRWLAVREGLVAPLQGAKTALWVSVVRATGTPIAGLPLEPKGLERAYGRGIVALNADLAGQWDAAARGPWVPLPTRLEQLRRAVEATPTDG